MLDTKIANAIINACDEIFVKIAIELLGGTKGNYSIVNPNEHLELNV